MDLKQQLDAVICEKQTKILGCMKGNSSSTEKHIFK